MNRGALRHADFRWFTAARLLWATASQMLIVAVGYQVYTLSRNPLDLGLIGLSQFLPFIVLTLPAGHAADVLDRRRLLQFCFALLAVCAAALAVVALSAPASTGPIIALMTLFGVARAVSMPTAQALTPNLVPLTDYPNAVAIGSTTFQAATIVGPAIGGVLLLGGATLVYSVTVAILVVATFMVFRVRGAGRAERIASSADRSLAAILSGIAFVRRKPLVLGAISLDMFAVLFGGAVALLPIYATDILDVGPTGLGFLRAAPAVGGLAAAVGLGLWPIRRGVGRWLFASVAAFGVTTVVFALSTSFLLSLVALALMGAADMVSVFIRHLVVQLATPDGIRGRVSAVNGVFIGASNELGDFESGVTAAWWGAVPAAVVGGVMVIVVAAAWAVLFPSLRRTDVFPSIPAATDPGSGDDVADDLATIRP